MEEEEEEEEEEGGALLLELFFGHGNISKYNFTSVRLCSLLNDRVFVFCGIFLTRSAFHD